MNYLGIAKETFSKALGPKSPSSLFSIGEKEPIQPDNSIWSIYSGVKKVCRSLTKDDKQEITVFIFEIKNAPSSVALARNCLKRAKTIRFPDCLKLIDAVETDNQIIIGTEFVRPLKHYLQNQRDENAIRLGLFKIAGTLKFLNQDSKIIHGNINENSIFVTKSGEWKLGGFELASPIGDQHLINFGSLLQGRFIPPESEPSNNTNGFPPHSFDAWAFGCFIQFLFNGKQGTTDQRQGKIPLLLSKPSRGFLSSNPTARLDFAKFIQHCSQPHEYFDNDMIKTSLFFENFALKDMSEKEEFLSQIESSIEKFPIEFCKYRILPQLVHALEYGGGGANALLPVLNMCPRLTQEEFEVLLMPNLTKLFGTSDKMLRSTLCQKIECYNQHLTEKTACEVIYPNLQTGFSDPAPFIRENTLKAIASLALKLSPKIINTSLLQNLSKLQLDPEPGIRTNTTICLVKLSVYINDAEKRRVLLPGFIRSLRDPFPFSRKAGLMGLSMTARSFSADEVAKGILPYVAPLTVDQDISVREQAFQIMDTLLKLLKEQLEKEPNDKPPESTNTQSPKANLDGWTSWAISAVSSGIRGKPSETSSTSSALDSKINTVHDGLTEHSTKPLKAKQPIVPMSNSSQQLLISSMKLPKKELQIQMNSEEWNNKDANGWDDDWNEPLFNTQNADMSGIKTAHTRSPQSNLIGQTIDSRTKVIQPQASSLKTGQTPLSNPGVSKSNISAKKNNPTKSDWENDGWGNSGEGWNDSSAWDDWESTKH